MLKERVASFVILLYFLTADNESLAQNSYSAYTNIEVHTLRKLDDKSTTKGQVPNNFNIEFLSQPKAGLKSVQAGNKALFVSQTQCEIYNFDTQKWSVKSLSVPRRNIAPVAEGSSVYLAGGCSGLATKPKYFSKIDLYNSETGNWSTAKLSEPRVVGASASLASIIIFAGGIAHGGYTDMVDIFDTKNNSHNTYKLSEPRTNMAVAAVNNKIIFAGGVTQYSNGISFSDVVDIFDIPTSKWSTAKLSGKRADMAATVVGNSVIFAGGKEDANRYANAVDLYHTDINEWHTTHLSERKSDITVAAIGNKVCFVGGVIDNNGALSNKVETYNISTGSWEIILLPIPRSGMAVGTTAHKVLFAGGAANEEANATDRIEILDIESGKWAVETLYTPRLGLASASYESRVIFAGGMTTAYPYPEYSEASAVVDVHTDPSVSLVTKLNITELPCLHNNGKSYVYLNLEEYDNCVVNVTILGPDRKVLFSAPALPLNAQLQEINITEIPDGSYQLLVEASGHHPVTRSFVIKNDKKEITLFTPVYATGTPQ